jgi:hypothetical protein
MNREVRVAVYWDFGDLHRAWQDRKLAADQGERDATDRAVDVAMIIDHASTLGRGVISRAYANWQVFAAYQDALHAHAIDLVQLFPADPRGQEDAAARLALDVVEDLYERPYVTHVVVIAGNHDYARLAQSCRKLGRIFIGVGAESAPERYIRACDEFTSYRALHLAVLEAAARRQEEILRQLRKHAVRIPDQRAAFWLAPKIMVDLITRFRASDPIGLEQLTAALFAALREQRAEVTTPDVNKLRSLYLRAGVIDRLKADARVSGPTLDDQSVQRLVLAHLVSCIRDLSPSDAAPLLAILCAADPTDEQREVVEHAVAQAISGPVADR